MPEGTDDGRASSPEDVCIQPQIITVKFQISETQIVAQVYPNCLTLSEVKIDIARKFEVDPDSLALYQNDEELPLTRTLMETCKNEYGIVEFSLRIINKTPIFTDEKIPELNLQIYYNKFRLADFVVVHIPAEESADGNSRDIVVEIQNKAIIKPFCGGYRDPKTNIAYHDAFTQTGPAPDRFKYEHIVSRDCQTVAVHTKSVETVQEHSTQSFGTATQLIHVTAATDYTITPKKYETYCEKTRRENKLAKVILIQRNFRAYLLRRYMRNAASEYRKLVEEQQRRDSRIKEKFLNKIHKECVTKTFPKTKDDFDLLYAQVQKWKEAEIKRIYSMYSDGPRIAEINCLLDKEIELLNGIENQRRNVCKALRDYRDDQILKKLGEPVKWVGYRNKVVEMDLLRNQRVRNLTALYKKMQKSLAKEERIELLEKVSALLRATENHPLLPDLMDLFEREKSLIVFAKSCDLTVLRQRQLVLFFEIIKNEREYRPKKPEMSMCEICKTVKPVKDFAIRTRQNSVDTCKRCFYLKGTAADNSIYKQMLRAVQRDERRRGTLSSYAFIMQEDDIRFLVEKVWHGHSALSKCNDITELRLPRWIIGDEWSPWNCVCLTEAETRVHIHLKQLSDLYEEKLLEVITTKNFLAKNTFKKLQEVDSNFVETGEWSDVGIKEKVV